MGRLRARDDQRGVALLIVLMLLATVAAVAVATTALVTRSVARAQAAQARDAGVWALRGVEAAALHLLETWDAAAPSPVGRPLALPVGDAVVRARLDAVACVNVNAFVTGTPGAYETPQGTGGSAVGPGIARFGRLVVALGGNEPAGLRLAEVAADFIDTDDAPNPGGAEDFDLARRDVPYLTAGRLLADTSELRAVPGWDSATYGALKRYLCALPSVDAVKVDVNGLRPGDAPVLAALFQTPVPIAEVERLIAARPDGGWASPADFAALPLPARAGVAAADVDVRPSVLSLSARADAAGQEFGMTALLFDDGSGWRVVSRRFGPPAPAPTTPTTPTARAEAGR